jgi:ABC-type multidrug transport system ATPase subunit
LAFSPPERTRTLQLGAALSGYSPRALRERIDWLLKRVRLDWALRAARRNYSRGMRSVWALVVSAQPFPPSGSLDEPTAV